MKKCCRCCEIKGLDSFTKCSYSKDKLSYACKQCRAKEYQDNKTKGKVAEYKERNKSKISKYNTEYQRKYRASPVKKNRKLAMCEYKGGKCVSCGFVVTTLTAAAFDFHHLDPNEKGHSPSDMVLMKWSRIIEELDKCVLLYSNCHRILHADNTVPSLLTEEGVTTIETTYQYGRE